MQTYTHFILRKRIIKILSVFTFVFSSMFVYGSDPITNHNSNFDIFYPFMDVEMLCNDEIRVYGPLTAEESGYIVTENGKSENNNVIIVTTNPEIALIKTGVFNDANGNQNAEVGEIIDYSFTVTNTGQVTIKDITIQDPLVNVIGSLASLAPSESNSTAFTASYPVTQDDINNGFVVNQATIEGCFDEPSDPNGNCEGHVTYLKLEYQGNIQNAQIKVIEHDGQTIFDAVVQPGEQFEFYGQQGGNPPTMGPRINVYINNIFDREIHTSCSQPIGIGSVFGDFEVIDGASKEGGPFVPIAGDLCTGEVVDLSDDNSNDEDDPTVVPLPFTVDPTPRDCTCSPIYKDSNFEDPSLISGNDLSVGAVYRFEDVFPTNPYGTNLDALVRIEEFTGGAGLLEIDVTSSGLDEAFQPRINSSNSNDQSVLFSITFVEDGGNYGDEVEISVYGTPLDIDGDGNETREYAEVNLPDAYFINNNTLLDIFTAPSLLRGEASGVSTAPGGDVSLDPRYTFSNYWENVTSVNYRIGKLDGNSDRYYSFNLTCADYDDPNSVLFTYPVICGNVSDEIGDPLAGVDVDVTGTDGSSQTVQTDNQGNYMAVAEIPEASASVTYEIRENDLPGYISISDVDGANDNLITREIELASSCGNDFVDGLEGPTGWNFECGDDKLVDEYGYNANCNITTVATIPNSGNIYQYVVEIVYKGSNPGQTIEVTDAGGTVHTLIRSVPVGGSSNVWVYRRIINGSTSSVTYTTTGPLKCDLQSLVIYAFRNVPDASSSSGVFTSRSGYNDVQTITLNIPAYTAPRDLIVEAPISELTEDGRYLLFRAESGGVSEEVFIYGPDASLPGGTCCLAIPTLTLSSVPGAATQVVITVDTRNNQNGQSVNGQSWVIASGVNVDGDCPDELECEIVDTTDVLCYGEATGSVTVMATGGTPPYSYSLNGGTPQSSATFNNLTAGVYLIEITDTVGNSCSKLATITQPEPISLQLTKVNATPAGDCMNGQATATPSGGTPPYTYSWANALDPTTEIGTTQTISGLSPGDYTVTVTDANNCMLEQSIVINCDTPCDVVISIDSITNVLCKGDSTGSATVSASSVDNPGPGAVYTFTWNTGQIDTGTSSTINNQAAGIYKVIVTVVDYPECSALEQSVLITEPATRPNVTTTSTDVTSPGGSDGTATAFPIGGTPPYTYSWANALNPSTEIGTTQTITGLSAGVYIVTVTDANGCTATASATVNDIPCRLFAIAISTDVSCNGGNDGAATVFVAGATGPLTYLWSPGGQTTQTITGLTAGIYSVTVTDTANGCVRTSTTTVGEPEAISYGIAVTDVLCFGSNTGSLDLTVSGGTPPYSFSWSPGGETTEDLINLTPGNYSVLITDANNCEATATATVSGPSSGLALTYNVVDVLCYGDNTGSVDIMVTGGTPPYSYLWSNGATTEDLTNIGAGVYFVIVTDANGCTLTENGITVTQPEPISLQLTKVDATPAGDCMNGQATATPSGGTPPYTYSWANALDPTTEIGTTQTIFGLSPGDYTVTVTDANNCMLEQSVVINCPDCDVVVSIDSITNVLCKGDSTGSATVSASSVDNPGPGAVYTFTWNTGQIDTGTSSTINNQAAGIYKVIVTVVDHPECSALEQSVLITEPATRPNVTTTSTDVTSPGGSDGTATAFPIGGTPPYTYSWANALNPSTEIGTTQTITGLSAGVYIVTVTDANGCTATASATVNDIPCRLFAIAISTDVSCNGGNDGAATVFVAGATGPLTYLWSPGGQTTQAITGLTAGVYSVTVTDTANGCVRTSTTTVGEPGQMSAGIAVTNIGCITGDSGSLDLTVSGGTPPYSFLWSPGGETTEDLIDLTAGTYNVLITDANGCELTATATVLQLPCPDIAIVKTAVYNGQGCSQVGDTIDYTFTVTNPGNVSLSNVLVHDPLLGGNVPGPDSGDTDGDDELDVTEIWIYTGSYAITQDDIDAGSVTNTATVVGTDPSGTVVNDTSNEIIIPLTPCPDINLVKTGVWVDGNGDQCADVGEMIDYTFTVTNAGNVSLSNIELTDTLLGGPIAGPDSGDTDGDDELDVTETWIYTASYAITQADIDAGSVTNTATVEGTSPDGTVTAVSSTEVTDLTPCPDINLVKTGVWVDGNGDQCADVGEMIDYTFTVTNAGNVSLSNIELTDTLLGGPIAGPDSGDTDGDDELDVTETWIYTASYAITQADIDAGSVTNTATVEGTSPDGTVTAVSSTEVTDLTPCPDINLVKTGVWVDGNGDQCADVGEMIDYTFTVTNAGNVSLSNIELTDTLLGGPIAGPDSGDTDGDDELDVTETWIYTASYAITQADIDAGSVTNTATVEGTSPDGTVTAVSSTEVTDLTPCPDINLVKTGVWVDGNGDQCADVGEMIDYTFTVTNAGNVSLSNIELTDTLLGGPIAGPDSGDTDGDDELDVTETWIYTASYAITQADIDAGSVTNTATVEGTSPDGTVTAVSSTEVTDLTACPAIALIKEGGFPPIPGGGCPVPGDVIEYTFRVKNTGNLSLTDVTVIDPLVTVVGGPISLAVGEEDTTTFTATYAITQDDIDAGFVLNQADAFGTTPGGGEVTDPSDNDSYLENDPTIVEICQTPVIALVKMGVFNDENQNKCSEVDETISYTFTVYNLGNVTLTNITISDPLINVQGGPITLAPLATDATSFTATYPITNDDINNGEVVNQATAEGTAPNGDVVTDLSHPVSEFLDAPTIVDLCQEPRIAIIKTGTCVDTNNNGCCDLDETIIYDFVVTNLGNVELTNVTVTDPMVTVIGGPVTIPALESDTETFSAVYTITQADIDAGQVVNQAIAEGTAPSGQVVTDLSDDNSNFENDSTVIELCQVRGLDLEKIGTFNDENDNGEAEAGETISYTFRVENTGNVTLFNITLTDLLPGIVIMGGPIEVLEPGEVDTDTFTATYPITQGDINTAFAEAITINGITQVTLVIINQALATGQTANGEDITDDGEAVVIIEWGVGSPFEIFNGITPNGDGLNDFFELRGIDPFPNNNVKIFNRWGVLVFETDGYNESDNVFRGVSNGRSTIRQGEELPTGTYFYILTFPGGVDDRPEDKDDQPNHPTSWTGYLYINR